MVVLRHALILAPMPFKLSARLIYVLEVEVDSKSETSCSTYQLDKSLSIRSRASAWGRRALPVNFASLR